MYERPSTRHKLLSRDASLNEGSASDFERIAGEVVVGREEMKRACPVPSSNHAKGRKKSKREFNNLHMMFASRRNASCSLCWDKGHRAMGFKCRIEAAYKANLIKWCDITEMAKTLGNPLYYEVKQPDEEASWRIHEWFSNGRSTAIPAGARHLVLLDIYYCGMERPVFKYNWIEVTVLGDRGKELSGWKKAYFTAHEIGEWLQTNCTSKQRNKHCLSTLREQTAKIQLSQDNVCFDLVLS
jgi:hypothetical protein